MKKKILTAKSSERPANINQIKLKAFSNLRPFDTFSNFLRLLKFHGKMISKRSFTHTFYFFSPRALYIFRLHYI